MDEESEPPVRARYPRPERAKRWRRRRGRRAWVYLPTGRPARRRLPKWARADPKPGEIVVLPAALRDRLRGIPGALWVSSNLPRDPFARRAFDLHFSLMSAWLAATRMGIRLGRVHYALGLGGVVLGGVAGANAIAESAPAVVAVSALGASVLTGAATILRAGSRSNGMKTRARQLFELAERTRRLTQYECDDLEHAEVARRLDDYTERYYELQRESATASE